MKSTEGSVVAHRLGAKTKYVLSAWAVPLQFVLVAVLGVAFLSFVFRAPWPRQAAVHIGMASALAAALNCRTRELPDEPRPFDEEHPDWKVLVKKIASSPNEDERKHVFLGIVCEEFE